MTLTGEASTARSRFASPAPGPGHPARSIKPQSSIRPTETTTTDEPRDQTTAGRRHGITEPPLNLKAPAREPRVRVLIGANDRSWGLQPQSFFGGGGGFLSGLRAAVSPYAFILACFSASPGFRPSGVIGGVVDAPSPHPLARATRPSKPTQNCLLFPRSTRTMFIGNSFSYDPD